MQRFGVLAMAICLIIIFGTGFGNSAWGQCVSSKTISAATDYGDNPLAESGNYDPCDEKLYYIFSFDRTSEDAYHNIIKYKLYQGSSLVVGRSADSRHYAPGGHYNISGTTSVGLSTQHNLQIIRYYGNPGYFENIEATAQYYSGSPD